MRTEKVIVEIERDGNLLLMRRSGETIDDIRWKPSRKGIWEFPGGGIKPKEAPYEAAAREVEEETGLRIRSLEFAGVLDGIVHNRHVRVHMFRATEFTGDARLSPEHDAFMRIPRERAFPTMGGKGVSVDTQIMLEKTVSERHREELGYDVLTMRKTGGNQRFSTFNNGGA